MHSSTPSRGPALYLTATVVSGFGTAALWLSAGMWVKELTGSSALAALAAFAMWAPTLVAPLLGTLADRVRRRPLLLALNLGLAALLCTLTSVSGPGDLWLLLAVLTVYGAAGVVHEAAETALVATAVPRERLAGFNGLRMTANESMKLLAPLAGAGLFAAYGGTRVALLDAATFVAAAGLYGLLRLREPRPARPAHGWRRRTAEGVRHLWRHAGLRRLVLAGGATMLLAGINGAAIYAVVDEGLGKSPAFVGVLYAVQGAGSVATGLLSGRLTRHLGLRRFASAGTALFAAGMALRAAPHEAAALTGSAAIGAGLPCILIAVVTSVQRDIPDPLVGRVAATANSLVYAPNAVGLGVGAGPVALSDHRVVLVGLGVVGLAVAAGLKSSPSGV